jgi:hypothetical protein
VDSETKQDSAARLWAKAGPGPPGWQGWQARQDGNMPRAHYRLEDGF